MIGTNWTMAVINILGDFDGNITFSQTDLELAGALSGTTNSPVTAGEELTFTYTVTNNSTVKATNVVIEQSLDGAHTAGGDTEQMIALGDLDPGASAEADFYAVVDSNLDYGTSTVIAVATVGSNESDEDLSDNASLLTVDAYRAGGDTSTTTDDGDDGTASTTDDTTSTSTDDGTGTTTDDGTGSDDESDDTTAGNNSNTSNNSSGGGGGGGGGSSKNKTKSIDRNVAFKYSGNTPKLIITKEASADKNDTVKAGEVVDYVITVKNNGSGAYDVTVYDTLINPIGSTVNEQSWDLGTVLSGELIRT
ncbi:MAG: CARDB domain-containing protein [Candidatus Paceibacterota bacterium]